jgi:hypothetical protein
MEGNGHLYARADFTTTNRLNPGTNWIGSWMDRRAGLEAEVEGTILPLPGFKPQLYKSIGNHFTDNFVNLRYINDLHESCCNISMV